MVYCEISGGLGNQFFQYASARAMADRLGTPLVLDLSLLNRDKDRELGLNRFRIPLTTVERIQPSLLSRLSKKLLRRDLDPVFLLEDPVWSHDERFNTIRKKHLLLRGYWADPKYFGHTRSRLLQEIVLKEEHYQKVAALVSRVQSANSCALHLRFGDFVSNDFAASFFGTLDVNYYRQAVTYILEQEPATEFFLFSDDLAAARRALSQIMDVEKLVAVNEDRRLHDSEEFFVMKSCKNFIAANSTFSWWAAWISNHPSKKIVQPRRYYKNEEAQHFYETQRTLIQDGAVLF